MCINISVGFRFNPFSEEGERIADPSAPYQGKELLLWLLNHSKTEDPKQDSITKMLTELRDSTQSGFICDKEISKLDLSDEKKDLIRISTGSWVSYYLFVPEHQKYLQLLSDIYNNSPEGKEWLTKMIADQPSELELLN